MDPMTNARMVETARRPMVHGAARRFCARHTRASCWRVRTADRGVGQGHCPGPGWIFRSDSSNGAHRLYGAAYALEAFIQPVQYVLLNVTTWRSSASVISTTSRK